MKKDFFATLDKNIQANKETLNELKVSVDYQKENVNYFYGSIDGGGIYVYLKPVNRMDGVTTSILLGSKLECGFKYLVKPLKRKSQKQIDLVAAQIEPLVKDFAKLWGEQDFNVKIAKKIETTFGL